jgi:hypothetical protein
MKPGKADLVRTSLFLLFLLATVPAYCQRGTLDLSVGETSDKFGALAPVTGTAFDLNGELTVIQPSQKNGGPSIVAGGEVRVPADTANHAKEFALYGGLAWGVHNLSIGVNAEVRKIFMPVATVNGQVLIRDNLELLELPLVIKYKFGPGGRAFLAVQGELEFSPHYKAAVSKVILPFPRFDHGYDLRGSVGYNVGKWWYVKGTYETRYFKFAAGQGNPTSLYNWKSNLITGGVGVTF